MHSSSSLNQVAYYSSKLIRSVTAYGPLRLCRIAAGVALGVLVTAFSVVGQSGQKVVAVVNGKQITEAEVDATVIGQLMPLEHQLYAIRKIALENLITRALLEQEAKKRGVTVDVLKKQLTDVAVEVNSEQVEEVYQENISAFASMGSDEAKERLRLDLESQARMHNYRNIISSLRANAQVDVFLSEPRLPSLNAEGAPSFGPTNAAVTIVEFSDFQCPYCRDSQSILKQVTATYAKTVRVVFKHLPLDIHDRAVAAAQAAYCADKQGQFWPFHDRLFAAKDLSSDAIDNIAKELRLNVAQLNACKSSSEARTAVLEDVREARRLGINSTPSFVINGRLSQGGLTLAEFKTIIDAELKAIETESRSLRSQK